MSDELVAQILNLSQTRSMESPCVRSTACVRWSPLRLKKNYYCRGKCIATCSFQSKILTYTKVVRRYEFSILENCIRKKPIN